MVVISYSGKEANAKIVYYGPGLGGKTTNLEFIYDSVPASSRGKMVSMKTQTDRTLFFDFLPLDLGELGGFKTRFLLYTVPGQVFYNATRKLVLRGVDAIAFIADSQTGKMDENKESLANLEENLAEYDLKLDDIPWVIQYNKRDMPEVYSVEELNRELNSRNAPYFEAVATEGTGVFETFRGLSRLLLERLSEEIGHRMMISKSFGRKQGEEAESEIAEVKPSPGPQVAAEVETEELEIIPEEAAATLQAEEPVEESIPELLEEQVEMPEAAPEPTIAHEQEILHGFFGETLESTPLQNEIIREEIILSREPAPPAEPVVAHDDQAMAGEQVVETEEKPIEVEPELEQLSEMEPAQASGESSQQTAEYQRPVEEVRPCESGREPSGQEPFFRDMVRRNNVGVFGHGEGETSEHVEILDTQKELVTDVKSLEQVIEIPASMLGNGKGNEIIITLRLRLKEDPEKKEASADEFLLDGISR